MNLQIQTGDSLSILKQHGSGSVNCCVTSPPYWGLRDYGNAGQLGLEKTPEEYIAKMVEVFREVRRVLRADGTLWLNIGDSYANDGKSGGETGGIQHYLGPANRCRPGREKRRTGLKPKDLVGIPWMLAFALRADGWYLRQDIIWSKPNPMPESVRDRCTKAHEYLFLMSKSERYYFDQEAISEAISDSSIDRLSQTNLEMQAGSDRVPGKTNGRMKAVYKKKELPSGWANSKNYREGMPAEPARSPIAGEANGIENRRHHNYVTRNKRSVWTVTTQPFKEAHFATFPENLVKPCILAGAPPRWDDFGPIRRQRNDWQGGDRTRATSASDRAQSGIRPNDSQAVLCHSGAGPVKGMK